MDRHGKAYIYNKGCRCPDCRQAKTDYVRRHRWRRRASDQVLVFTAWGLWEEAIVRERLTLGETFTVVKR
jgi:hypothetical protein